jgi:hypothetical protein
MLNLIRDFSKLKGNYGACKQREPSAHHFVHYYINKYVTKSGHQK